MPRGKVVRQQFLSPEDEEAWRKGQAERLKRVLTREPRQAAVSSAQARDPLTVAVDEAVGKIVSIFDDRLSVAAPKTTSVPVGSVRTQRERAAAALRDREDAAAELLVAPGFGFSEVEAVQEDFVSHLRFHKLSSPRARLRERLTSETMLRLVGLSVHLLYWTVLGPHPVGNDVGPSEAERSQLVSETLGCYADFQDEAKRDLAVVAVGHLSLHCAVERLFCSAYRWFRAKEDPQVEATLLAFHRYLASLFDPHGYHAQYLALHHRGDDLASNQRRPQRVRLQDRFYATSPTLRVLFPAPTAPRARALAAKATTTLPVDVRNNAGLGDDDDGRRHGGAEEATMVLPVINSSSSSSSSSSSTLLRSVPRRGTADLATISDNERPSLLHRLHTQITAGRAHLRDEESPSPAKRLSAIKRAKAAQLKIAYIEALDKRAPWS